MQETDVVVGGGIAGLVAALLLAERDGRKVVVIERESEVGGLLKCYSYGENGAFDYGMHNMYETGIAELDALLFGLLPQDQWQMLEGPKRDLVGVYFRSALQYHSPFPDLRLLPPKDWDVCVAGFFRQFDSGISFGHGNAYDDARTQFGTPIADMVIDPAVRKQFGKPAKELAAFATRLTTLSRVVMFGEEHFRDLVHSHQLRERLAYPEQRTLPVEWESGRKAYYPKAYGMYRIVDALRVRLQAAGVEMLTSSSVRSVLVEGSKVRNVEVVVPQGLRNVGPVGRLVWTSGLPAIANLLEIDTRGYHFDPPRKTVIVNLLLRDKPKMGDLYYIYCYEPGCHTFRITHFGAYCEGAPRKGGHPLAVEMLLDEPLPSADGMKAIALEELQRFGVINGPDDVVFSAVELLSAGFPMPSCGNFKALADIRERIGAKELSNLVMLGIMSEENVFFQRDVLAQAYAKLSKVASHG
jgi:phytoene dehydrogenase-like protein